MATNATMAAAELLDVEENSGVALVITLICSLATGLGGVIVWVLGETTNKQLAHTLSFSAGVMMYISFLDLMPDAIELIGLDTANIAFFGGILFFGMVHQFIPEVELTDAVPATTNEESTAAKPKPKKTTATRGRSTTRKRLPGKAGSRSRSRKRTTTAAKASAAAATSVESASKAADRAKLQKSLLMTGIVTAAGMSLHNFPEGIAVYLTCLKGVEVGLPTSLAIALHNIPEGVCVAMPIAVATGSRWQGVKYSFLSGLCEPLGALLFGYFFAGYLTEEMLNITLAAVAGVMVYICNVELMPTALKHLSGREACLSQAVGMSIMAVSMHFLRRYNIHSA